MTCRRALQVLLRGRPHADVAGRAVPRRRRRELAICRLEFKHFRLRGGGLALIFELGAKYLKLA